MLCYLFFESGHLTFGAGSFFEAVRIATRKLPDGSAHDSVASTVCGVNNEKFYLAELKYDNGELKWVSPKSKRASVYIRSGSYEYKRLTSK